MLNIHVIEGFYIIFNLLIVRKFKFCVSPVVKWYPVVES